MKCDAGWSSSVARQAHNLKVVGSNPTPATNLYFKKVFFFFHIQDWIWFLSDEYQTMTLSVLSSYVILLS